MSRKLFFLALFLLLVFSCGNFTLAAPPKNVIFLIGDGMGFEQVKAAGMYSNGAAGTLCFESFPYQAEVTTYSADSVITDSAASATAIATGHKVNNGVISIASPGDANELRTLLEYFRDAGKTTGLVTTTYTTHATPAAFGAHEPSRSNLLQIAGDYLNQTRPNVLLGGGAKGMTSAAAIAAGYTVVTDRAGLLALDANAVSMVAGLFGSTHLPYEYDGLGSLPHLSEMTVVALDVLDNEPNGFFLMVEGGRIDHAGHNNDLQRNIFETIEFADTVQEANDWAAGRTDTLIVVTADHETGGLTVIQNKGQGKFPAVSWYTTGHTAANVPVYAWGVNAHLTSGTLDNTEFFQIDTINYPDYDSDSNVNFSDYTVFASQWNRSDCGEPDYCDGADVNLSGAVDLPDLEIFAYYWLK